MSAYKAFHERSIKDPEGFWAEQAKLVEWQKPFDPRPVQSAHLGSMPAFSGKEQKNLWHRDRPAEDLRDRQDLQPNKGSGLQFGYAIVLYLTPR